MRKITNKGKEVDYTSVANMSKNYDARNFRVDTEYMKINIAVLGNATGLESVDEDDTSSALAAVHGRKYNNGSVAIPFTRKFVTDNYDKIDGILQEMARKASGACAELQKMMKPEDVKEGREMAMRSQAIRDAKKELTNSGSVVNSEIFSDANRNVRGKSKSKVYFQYGIGVSARRVEDTIGLEQKGQFKRKNISSADGDSVTAYTTTADESGLKKIPIMDSKMRTKAEEFVYNAALVIKEEVDKLSEDFDDKAALTALEAIRDKMPGNDKLKADLQSYSDEELEQIRLWKDEIVSNYRSI